MKLPFTLDEGTGQRAALGIIVLQSDETLEAEFRQVFDIDGVALYHSRIPNAAEVSTDTLRQMEHDLPAAAALLPTTRPLDVVGYGCTSAATVIGPARIAAIVQGVHPEALVTNPISSVMAAFRHMGVKRLGLVTPYAPEVSQAMREMLEGEGFEVSAFGSFEQSQDPVVARITPRSVCQAICKIGRADEVEAVFASCTNLRSFGIIDEAETYLGKPVITSNQALAWHMLTLAGIGAQGRGPGHLFGKG